MDVSTGTIGTVTYSISGLTSDNIANGIGAIDLDSSNTVEVTGIVQNSAGQNMVINDTLGNAISGVTLNIKGTYHCE